MTCSYDKGFIFFSFFFLISMIWVWLVFFFMGACVFISTAVCTALNVLYKLHINIKANVMLPCIKFYTIYAKH